MAGDRDLDPEWRMGRRANDGLACRSWEGKDMDMSVPDVLSQRRGEGCRQHLPVLELVCNSNRKGGMVEGLVGGMIRNSRSDGPGDCGRYGMGDCNFVTRGLHECSLRAGAWKHKVADSAGDGNLSF